MVRRFVAIAGAVALFCAHSVQADSARSQADMTARIRLPGHVLTALDKATPVAAPSAADTDSLTLTVVLRRADQAGFDRYLHDVYDPNSPSFHHFLRQSELADTFGPTSEAYRQVWEYLRARGFELVEGTANRLTLTVRGSRATAEQAFAVRIGNYRIGDRSFYANDRDPDLPTEIAARVAAVSGLSNLALAKAPLKTTTAKDVKNACWNDALGLIPGVSAFQAYLHQAQGGQQQDVYDQYQDLISVVSFMSAIAGSFFTFTYFSLPNAVGNCVGFYLGYTNRTHNFFLSKTEVDKTRYAMLAANDLVLTDIAAAASPHGRVAAAGVANSQKIGLLEFDSFHSSDVRDWLNLLHANPGFADRLSEVPVNGGAGGPGTEESEVLLDIVTVMLADPSANTSYVVYDAPRSTSFQQMFNAMINGGVSVISNSWTECEDQHSLADVQSIDSVLAQAAASGISVLNGSGDSGATCLDGSPNTVGVPANSPHATAVGGSSPSFAPGLSYGQETWWNGTGELPPTGQGGFGLSRYFLRPAYQNGLTASAMRSVPDVVVDADPRAGISICQADAGGCPSGLLYGGTSMAAPLMAGMVAYLNENLGSNIGEVNPALYPLAVTNAFHSPTSMGADFAHVGLGSPNFDNLLALLSHYHIGPVDPSISDAGGTLLPVADGTTLAILRVNLNDANHFHVAGKTVNLISNAGSHAIVSASSGPSEDTNGAVTFAITDTVAEKVTFTVVDTTDGITLTTQPELTFVTPPAASASINASPMLVSADGVATTTITVMLQDARGQDTPGKLVTLAQGNGHSIITGPSPPLTDGNGQIQFTATDNVGETVIYTAVDATDGNLPVPGSASVTFTGGSTSCIPTPATAASGFTLTPFANGFVARNFFFGNINFIGCPGASNPAFDTSGSVFVSDFPNGNLYKFASTGGAVSTANLLANLGPTFGNLVFGKDGSLYGTHFSPSNIVQVDPATGAVMRTVASGFTCPSGLAVDPLSGDLFFDDDCTGGGSDNPRVWRIQNPSGTSPTVTVYAMLPATPGGGIAFAPDGTMYVVANAFTSTTQPIVQIGGTNTPSPPTVATLSGITSDDGSIAIGTTQPSGAAKSLIIHTGGVLKLVDITTNPFTTIPLANGTIAAGVIGPDGCLYSNAHDTILKLAPASGGCVFNPTNPSPSVSLAPPTVSPNPAQGTSQSFTATLQHVPTPAGTPVFFQVIGANPQVKLVNADANGRAPFSYTAVTSGNDTVVAAITINTSTLTSNPVQVTWTPGQHTTFLTLNPSPTSSATGAPVTVIASLTDVSADPVAALGGRSVTFMLDGGTCSALTDASGTAACAITPLSPPGQFTLTASFAGNAQFLPASDSRGFDLTGASTSSGPTNLTGNITGKTGPQNARTWAITLYSSGPGAANGAQITTLSLTQTFGAACRPAITGPSAFPLTVGNIAGGGSLTGAVTIDFTGCAANARFRVDASFTANQGAVVGSMVRYNQYE